MSFMGPVSGKGVGRGGAEDVCVSLSSVRTWTDDDQGTAKAQSSQVRGSALRIAA